jgi:hypothetical protein
MLEARIDKIPNYVTAKTAQGLRRVMLLNNIKKNFQFVYNVQFAEGKWFAWFVEETRAGDLSGDTDRAG